VKACHGLSPACRLTSGFCSMNKRV
jgi:hypothetical protein